LAIDVVLPLRGRPRVDLGDDRHQLVEVALGRARGADAVFAQHQDTDGALGGLGGGARRDGGEQGHTGDRTTKTSTGTGTRSLRRHREDPWTRPGEGYLGARGRGTITVRRRT